MPLDFVRICSTFMIFMCHVFIGSGTRMGGYLGQVFSVGVTVFFLLSGYLHGRKGTIENAGKWYIKKCKRLFLPYYLFLLIVFFLHLLKAVPIKPDVWLQTVFPICGITEKYLSGCGHLWFLTHLLICYGLTPFLAKLSLKKWHFWIAIAAWLLGTVLFAYTLPPIWCTLLNSIFTYFVGYFGLPLVLSWRRKTVRIAGAVTVSCAVRLLFWRLFDGTPLYEGVATNVSSLLLGLAILDGLYQVGVLMDRALSQGAKKRIFELSKRTYCFYLVHYIFLNGALRVQVFQKYVFNAGIAFVLSLAFAEIVYKLTMWIDRRLPLTGSISARKL